MKSENGNEGTGYKAMLDQARNLMGKAGENAWRRAKILIEVFNSADFRADFPGLDDFRLADRLDEYCGDLAVRFLKLKQLLEFYPKKSDWATGNIQKMYDAMLKHQDEARKAAMQQRPKQVRQRATLQEFNEMRNHAERCENAANTLKSRLEESQVKVAELEAVAAPIIEAAEKNGLSPEELVVRIPTALERIAELEAENASLREQLEAANRRIAELEAELSECRSGDAVLV